MRSGGTRVTSRLGQSFAFDNTNGISPTRGKRTSDAGFRGLGGDVKICAPGGCDQIFPDPQGLGSVTHLEGGLFIRSTSRFGKGTTGPLDRPLFRTDSCVASISAASATGVAHPPTISRAISTRKEPAPATLSAATLITWAGSSLRFRSAQASAVWACGRPRSSMSGRFGV